MAQTVILVSALFLLLVLALLAAPRKSAGFVPSSPAAPSDALRQSLPDAIKAQALRFSPRGLVRLRASSGALRLLKQALENPAPLSGLQMLRQDSRSLLSHLMALQQDLRQTLRLPGNGRGEARMMVLCREVLRHAGTVDARLLSDSLLAWQEASPTTLAERLALPLCMRLTLEMQLTDVLRALVDDARQAQMGAKLARRLLSSRHPMALVTRRPLTLECTDALLTALRRDQKGELLAALDELMEQSDLSAAELARRHAARQAAHARQVSQILASFRSLDKLDWPALEETEDPLHQLLSEDPAGIYDRMDHDSRSMYRHQAAHLARLFRVDETRLTRGALALASQTEPDGLMDHVGWYLTQSEGMRALHRHLRARGGAAALWCSAHADTLYRVSLGTAALCAAAVFLLAGQPLLMLPFFLSMVSCVTHFAGEWLLPRIKRALPLPRMEVRRVTEQERTLVVIPAVLRDPEQALSLVRRLVCARKAFPEGAIDCLLLADYADNMTVQSGEDAAVTEAAREAIEAVDGMDGRFVYLQRRRVWDKDQRAYIGRERKRGALETLNRLITHGECDDLFDEATVSPAFFHRRYLYVLTLDSDTIPAPDVILPLIGALSHPLNARRHTPEGPRGISILQPRMEVDPDTVITPVGLLMGGAGGVDDYGAGDCGLWQRLCGRGSFQGKGLYRPDAVLEATEPYILPDTILSHDLLEGELAGCAQMSEAALYDGHPASVTGWLRRLHRWTRGDWQLLPWTLPFLNTPGGVKRNPLPSRSRCKIRDCLRRSLIPLCRLVVLLYGVYARSPFMTALALIAPGLSALLPPSVTGLARFLSELALLPLRAAIRLDAASRALWRMLVSHTHRLDWVPSARDDRGGLTLHEGVSQGVSAVLMAGFALRAMPPNIPGLIMTALFGCFPFLHTRLDAPLRHPQRLSESNEAALMDVADATWRFFEETVTAADHFLPPDNLQLKPWRGLARRTSPTNIGMYLLSCLAARELGLIDTDEAARRIAQTMDTLERLPLWRGLPYNWYSTETLGVLPPAYVSTVDSGNLCACLMCVAQGLRALLREMDASTRDLPARLDDFAARMELSALYDPASHLFFLGMKVDKEQPDPCHYDLYASEARLTSFIAVMRREVPLRHFSRLNRTLVRAGNHAPLLSWSGTMFEYLMPQLLLPVSPGTMMDDTISGVIAAQRRHAPEGVFGVSESGWWGFDREMHYQYRAFGLPELSADLPAPGLVIAPYAAALCLPFDLENASDSLMRLRSLSMLSRLGYFESIDFDPAHLPSGVHQEIVQSHMAHHQGMLLCALCNALTENSLVRTFTVLPVVQAYSLLLKEKRVPRLTLPPRLMHPAPPALPENAFRRPGRTLSSPVDAHMIGSPDACLLMSAQGDGMMRSRGLYLTRFTGDPTETEGIQFYIRDGENLWQPTDPTLEGGVEFSEGCIRFSRTCGLLRCVLTAITEPVHGAFVHQLELTNLSTSEKTVEAADFLRPSLETRCSDHPAFSDLFIQTDRPDERVLTVTRRPREKEDAPLTLCHAVSTSGEVIRLTAQTDRMAFQGRDGSLHAPLSMLSPMEEGLIGAPIHPCASFRLRLRLGGRGRTTVLFITHLVRENETISPDTLTPRATDASGMITLSRLLSRVVTDSLPLPQEEAATLSRLFGPLLWRFQAHQGAVSPVPLPMGALGEMGLDPTLPLFTVIAVSRECGPLVRQALHVTGWMALMGQQVNLCILTEGDTAADAYDEASRLADASLKQGRQAVVFRAAELREGLRETLEAMSGVILYESAGNLSAQLDALTLPLPVFPRKSVSAVPRPPEEPLSFSCGLGGFQPSTGDYVTLLEAGQSTPAPWCNLLTGDRFGTLAMESGLNMTFADNSHLHRLTAWSNDPVCPACSEAVYLMAGDDCFTPTRLPMGQDVGVRVQHGTGVTIWQGYGHGLDMSLTASVLPGRSGGVRTLRIRNRTGSPMRLTAGVMARFVMGTGGPEESLTCLTPVADGVFAVNPAMPQMGFLCLPEGTPDVRRLTPLSFAGLWPGIPAGLMRAAGQSDGGGSVAVVSLPLNLAPDASASFTWVIGAARAADDVERMLQAVRQTGASAIFRTVRSRWAQRLDQITVSTPEDSLNLLINRMLPWQVRASRLEARCGFYQAGGAIGFRDQLQDMTALTLTEPARVRAHLLLCARHQYVEGDVQHWWHPPQTGVRTRISDDKLFLPFMTAWYVERTGDRSVLDELAPWLAGAPLEDGQNDLYTTPAATDRRDTLYVHCLQALTSVRLGPRGLPLMGGGDWNDGMNRVCGESVWLGMFYAQTLHDFAALTEGDARDEMLAMRKRVLEAVEQFGWDGAWYLRAFFADDTPLGGASGAVCRIDSLSQSWAVLSGCQTERAAQALQNAWDQLYDPRLGLMKLLAPPFDGVPEAGYIGGYLPGIRENGGQYTHAAAWMLWALSEMGWSDRAWELVRALNPIHHADSPEKIERYRLEPYALAGDVYANPQQAGRGGWSMYTGSAAWLYTIVLEKLLGLEKRGARVRLRPLVPDSWDAFTLTMRYGGATWHFYAGRDVPFLTCDGEKEDGDWISLTDDGRIHQVRTPLRAGRS